MCSTRACVGSEDGGTPPDRCGPMSKSPHQRHLPLAYRVIVFFIRPLLMLTTKRAWRGGANLPTEGGFIACPNHLSHTDFLLFAHLMYDSGRPAFFLGKSELFKLPVLGWALAKAEQIPVYRGTQKATEAYRAAVAAVRSGKAVAMYPEGTITRDPDIWPMRGKTGAARVALETRCPVIPVTMWGPQAIMGPYERGFHLFPRKTIEVIVGAPVDLADVAVVLVNGSDNREYQRVRLSGHRELGDGLRGRPRRRRQRRGDVGSTRRGGRANQRGDQRGLLARYAAAAAGARNDRTARRD